MPVPGALKSGQRVSALPGFFAVQLLCVGCGPVAEQRIKSITVDTKGEEYKAEKM